MAVSTFTGNLSTLIAEAESGLSPANLEKLLGYCLHVKENVSTVESKDERVIEQVTDILFRYCDDFSTETKGTRDHVIIAEATQSLTHLIDYYQKLGKPEKAKTIFIKIMNTFADLNEDISQEEMEPADDNEDEIEDFAAEMRPFCSVSYALYDYMPDDTDVITQALLNNIENFLVSRKSNDVISTSSQIIKKYESLIDRDDINKHRLIFKAQKHIFYAQIDLEHLDEAATTYKKVSSLLDKLEKLEKLELIPLDLLDDKKELETNFAKLQEKLHAIPKTMPATLERKDPAMILAVDPLTSPLTNQQPNYDVIFENCIQQAHSALWVIQEDSKNQDLLALAKNNILFASILLQQCSINLTIKSLEIYRKLGQLAYIENRLENVLENAEAILKLSNVAAEEYIIFAKRAKTVVALAKLPKGKIFSLKDAKLIEEKPPFLAMSPASPPSANVVATTPARPSASINVAEQKIAAKKRQNKERERRKKEEKEALARANKKSHDLEIKQQQLIDKLKKITATLNAGEIRCQQTKETRITAESELKAIITEKTTTEAEIKELEAKITEESCRRRILDQEVADMDTEHEALHAAIETAEREFKDKVEKKTAEEANLQKTMAQEVEAEALFDATDVSCNVEEDDFKAPTDAKSVAAKKEKNKYIRLMAKAKQDVGKYQQAISFVEVSIACTPTETKHQTKLRSALENKCETEKRLQTITAAKPTPRKDIQTFEDAMKEVCKETTALKEVKITVAEIHKPIPISLSELTERISASDALFKETKLALQAEENLIKAIENAKRPAKALRKGTVATKKIFAARFAATTAGRIATEDYLAAQKVALGLARNHLEAITNAKKTTEAQIRAIAATRHATESCIKVIIETQKATQVHHIAIVGAKITQENNLAENAKLKIEENYSSLKDKKVKKSNNEKTNEEISTAFESLDAIISAIEADKKNLREATAGVTDVKASTAPPTKRTKTNLEISLQALNDAEIIFNDEYKNGIAANLHSSAAAEVKQTEESFLAAMQIVRAKTFSCNEKKAHVSSDIPDPLLKAQKQLELKTQERKATETLLLATNAARKANDAYFAATQTLQETAESRFVAIKKTNEAANTLLAAIKKATQVAKAPRAALQLALEIAKKVDTVSPPSVEKKLPNDPSLTRVPVCSLFPPTPVASSPTVFLKIDTSPGSTDSPMSDLSVRSSDASFLTPSERSPSPDVLDARVPTVDDLAGKAALDTKIFLQEHLLSKQVNKFKALLLQEVKSSDTPTPEEDELLGIIRSLDQLKSHIDVYPPAVEALKRLEAQEGSPIALVVGNIPRDTELGRELARVKRSPNGLCTEYDIDLLTDASFEQIKAAFPRTEYKLERSKKITTLFTVTNLKTKDKYQIIQSEYFVGENAALYKANPLIYDALSRDLLHNAIFADKQGLVYTPLLGTLLALAMKLVHVINKKALYEVEGKAFDESKISAEELSYREDPRRLLRGILSLITCGTEFKLSDEFEKSISAGIQLLIPESKDGSFTKNQITKIRLLNIFFSSKVFCCLDSEAKAIFQQFNKAGVTTKLFPGVTEKQIDIILQNESSLEDIYICFFLYTHLEEFHPLCKKYALQESAFFVELTTLIDKLIVDKPLYKVCFGDHRERYDNYCGDLRAEHGYKARIPKFESIAEKLMQKLSFYFPEIQLPMPLPVKRSEHPSATGIYGTSKGGKFSESGRTGLPHPAAPLATLPAP